jgi:hypothetical protein
MQLGFVTAILPDLTLPEILAFASAEGFECVEVMCWPLGKADRRYAGVTHLKVTTFDSTSAEVTREMLNKYNVTTRVSATILTLRALIQLRGRSIFPTSSESSKPQRPLVRRA